MGRITTRSVFYISSAHSSMVFPVSQVWAQDFSFTLYFGVQMSSFKITLNFTLGDILSSLFLSLEQPIFSLELASVVVFSGNAKERV